MSYTQEVEKTDRYGREYIKTQRRRARGITSIDENVRVNQALWGLASFVADVKMGRVKIEPVQTLPAVVSADVNA